MKVRLALVAGLILVLVGAVSIVALAKQGTVTAGIVQVFDVTLTNDTVAFGDITTDAGGAGGSYPYLGLTVNSNVTYTVELGCSGNLNIIGMADNGVNEIETEYAVWKEIDWHDHYSQQPTPCHVQGWLDDIGQWHFSGNTDVTWFEAENGGSIIQGGNRFPEVANTSQDAFPGLFFLPEHGSDYSWWYDPSWTGTWNPNWYNHGAALLLKIYPFLDVFEGYGTRAGSYSGTFTVVVTSVNSTVP